MTPDQAKALKEYQDAVDAYANGGQQQYSNQGDLVSEDLGASQMGDIHTDPAYKEHEMAALKELEDQSRNGFTASDKAAMAGAESQANRANAGRIGAIKQNMDARGMGGSGMDLVAQMQSSQDANELEAMKELERTGMMADRKTAATQQLGSMSSNLQQRDFGQAAQKAQAADQIARFNNANRMQAQQYNVGNHQNVANQNVAGANTFSHNVMGAKTGAAQVGYDAATEEENRQELLRQQREAKRAAKRRAMGQLAGGVLGGAAGMYASGGSPQGGAAGAGAGSNLGGGVMDAFGSDPGLKDNLAPEHEANMDAFLALLEPKSYTYKGEDKPRHGVSADDLAKSKLGTDMLRVDEDGMKHVDVKDAVSTLLAAVAHLNKKVSK